MSWNPPLKAALLAVFVLTPAAYGDDEPSTQWRSVDAKTSTASSTTSDSARSSRDGPAIAFPSSPSSTRRPPFWRASR